MALFDRLSRVVRAELNYAKNQSVNPEQEVDRAISMLQDAVIKTRLALITAPTEYADILKRNLIDLETKLTNAQVRRAEFVARIKETNVNQQLQKAVGRLGTLERMEEKVWEMESHFQAIGELTGHDLEQQFAMLESGSDVDEELAAMKAQLMGSSVSQQTLPTEGETEFSQPNAAVDAELESLRSQLKNM
jgi:phage shock protein A